MKFPGFVFAVMLLASSLAQAQDPAMSLWDLYKEGRFEEVEQQGKALLNTGNESGSILLAVGRSLADMQRQDEALFFLQRAVAADPNKSWVYAWGKVYLGKCRYYLQEMDLARDALIQARDCGATANATNEASHYLKIYGLDDSFSHWSHLESEHFSFHFSPSLMDSDREVFSGQHEQMYDYLTTWFKAVLGRKIQFFIWENREEAQLAGMPELGFASVDNYLIHVRFEQPVGHELTHIISHYAIEPELKTGLINEGTATSFDGTGRDWFELARQARIAQAKRRGANDPIPLSVMGLWLDWESQTEDVSYPVAGAFVSMLIKMGGRDKFLEAFKNQSPGHFQTVYGADLTSWINDFDASMNE